MKHLLLTVLVTLAPSVSAQLLENVDWENGIPDQFRQSTSNQVDIPTVTNEVACSGSKSLKFHINYRDDYRGYRNELALAGPNRDFDYGKEYWVSWAIFLPDNYRTDAHSEILFQFHGVPDENSQGDLIEAYRNPNVALFTGSSGNWSFALRGDDNKITVNKQYSRYKSYDLGSFLADRGKWTEFTLKIVFDYRSGGRAELWKNGEKVVDDYGANAFNDDTPPYLKIGIYKSSWRENTWGGLKDVASRTIFYDKLRIAENSSFQEMSPQCGPLDNPKSPVIFN